MRSSAIQEGSQVESYPSGFRRLVIYELSFVLASTESGKAFNSSPLLLMHWRNEVCHRRQQKEKPHVAFPHWKKVLPLEWLCQWVRLVQDRCWGCCGPHCGTIVDSGGSHELFWVITGRGLTSSFMKHSVSCTDMANHFPFHPLAESVCSFLTISHNVCWRSEVFCCVYCRVLSLYPERCLCLLREACE